MKLELAAFLLATLPRLRVVPSDARQPFLDAECLPVTPPDDVPAPAAGPIAPAGGRPKAQRKPPAPPLAPKVAARRFVTWMQEHDFTGEKPTSGDNGIWAFYGWHCQEANVQPVPDNMFFEALARVIPRRQVRDRSSGKLKRNTYYTIPELPEPSASALRKAA